MTIANDPVGQGLVTSLARGRQCHRVLEFSDRAKYQRLEVLKDAIPSLPELGFCGRRKTAHHPN